MTPNAVQITRHMITVKGERQVHYRRAGSGPPIVILHQSPTSSDEYLPLIAELAREFTVFAPDTAGNGMSDPLLKPMPDMEDYADGAVDLLDALGLGKVPLYGFHTGGVCALALGLRHPDRTSVTIMNGYVQMPPAVRDDFLTHYLPEFKPDWTGMHLIWAWSRFREQTIFFPWYRKDSEHRMSMDQPDVKKLHWQVMQFFRAGDNYRRAYRPPFAFDTANAVRNMKANMVIITAKTDVLDQYMSLMPSPPKNVTVMQPKDMAEATKDFTELFRKHAHGAAPPVAATQPMPGRIWAEYLPVEGGSLYARRNTDGSGRPIVFIHSSAASSFSMDSFMRPFIGKRPVLAVDLPGNGESDNPMGLNVTVEAQAKYLAMAIRAAGYTEVDAFGHWGGAAVGIELAVQNPSLIKNLAATTLMIPEGAYLDKLLKHYTPDVVPDLAGSHLIRVWHMIRDQLLFAPWFNRTKQGAITKINEVDLAPEVIHQRTVDLLKAVDIYQAAYAVAFKYPVLERLAKTACRVLIGSHQTSEAERALNVLGNRGVTGKTLGEFFGA